METTKKETAVTALTASEKKTLKGLTDKLRTALKSFVTIGELHYQVLPLVVRAYKNVKEFIETELGISETHYYKQVRAYDVYKLILDSKFATLPHCESVVRSITSEYTYSQLVVKYGKPADNEAESKIRAKANQLTCEAWELACKSGKPTAIKVQDAWVRTVMKHFPVKENKPADKAPANVNPDPLKGKTEAEKAAAILGGVSAGLVGHGPNKDTEKGCAGTDSANKTEPKQLDSNTELNKLRSELAEVKESKAKLEIALRQGSAEYAKTKLFKEVFEAGVKAVRLAAMSQKDNDKISALEDLKKAVGLA